jgi:hypothetical protein
MNNSNGNGNNGNGMVYPSNGNDETPNTNGTGNTNGVSNSNLVSTANGDLEEIAKPKSVFAIGINRGKNATVSAVSSSSSPVRDAMMVVSFILPVFLLIALVLWYRNEPTQFGNIRSESWYAFVSKVLFILFVFSFPLGILLEALVVTN